MTLRELQSQFVVLLAALVSHAKSQGYELTLGEGYIATPRKARSGDLVEDGVHMKDSLHYLRLAQDLNLFVGGAYVSGGNHPAWLVLGEFWEGLNPACRWGGRFAQADANHFSLFYGGRA